MKEAEKEHGMAITRRGFLKGAGTLAAGAAIGFPTIVPGSVFGQNAPSKRIAVGFIGTGRQWNELNAAPFLEAPDVTVAALCDVDGWRLEQAKKRVETYYAAKSTSGKYSGAAVTRDFRKLIERPDIDAVMIGTPDHWHVPMALMAVKAGKDVCCAQPLTLSIEEGRLLADAVKKHNRIFRTDSEFRSIEGFHRMAELVRNGRIGKVNTIYIGLPKSEGTCPPEPAMPVPPELDYEMWLGPAPAAPYTMKRVHTPRDWKDSPGWMRVLDTCEGPLIAWATHLSGIAQWCLGTERTGPVEVEASGIYPPREHLWNVLTEMRATYQYASGVTLHTSVGRPRVRIEGGEGWLEYDYNARRLRASSDKVLKAKIREDEIRFPLKHEKRDFIDCVKSREQAQDDAEVGHRTCSMGQIAHIAIKLGGKKLSWDPEQELFNDEAANKLKQRPAWREPWSLEELV